MLEAVNFRMPGRLNAKEKVYIIKWCYHHRDKYADRSVKRYQFWDSCRRWIAKKLQVDVASPDAVVRRLEKKRRMEREQEMKTGIAWPYNYDWDLALALDNWIHFLDRLDHGELLLDDMEPPEYRRIAAEPDIAEMGETGKNEAEAEMIRHIKEHEEEAIRAKREEEYRQQLNAKYESTDKWVTEQEILFRDAIKRSLGDMNSGDDDVEQQQEDENEEQTPRPAGDDNRARKRRKVDHAPRNATPPPDDEDNNNGDSGVAGLSPVEPVEPQPNKLAEVLGTMIDTFKKTEPPQRDEFVDMLQRVLETFQNTDPLRNELVVETVQEIRDGFERMERKIDALEQKINKLSEVSRRDPIDRWLQKGYEDLARRRSSRLQNEACSSSSLAER
ncbi:hypothetical protein VTN00DRAFT_7194 [Thermoascus crustaceus]|uniref:uncharacterized protein n=1 Tax=Thermoascus crustaceus TaxID=5088 RepID=UPI0037444F43